MSAKRKPTLARAVNRRKTASRKKASTLNLVREGVRRFILNDVSIGDFQKDFLNAVENGELSRNPLTGAAFRKIVKEAIRGRKRKARRPS